MAVIGGFYTNPSWKLDYRAIFCVVSSPPAAQRPPAVEFGFKDL